METFIIKKVQEEISLKQQKNKLYLFSLFI